eukprot:10159532-Ditylum_brightwellii.AAC.1
MFDEKAKKIEKAGLVHLPSEFLQQLDERLAKVDTYSENEKGGSVCEPKMGMIQADSLLAY